MVHKSLFSRTKSQGMTKNYSESQYLQLEL